MDRNEPKPSHSFENKVRSLSPSPASAELKRRLEKSLSNEELTQNRSLIILFVAATAAAIAFSCVLFVMNNQDGADLPEIAETKPFQSIGQQHFIVESSAPVLVEIPDAAPMWKIDMKLLNRDFIETPEGLVATQFEPENRSVFLPVVYH